MISLPISLSFSFCFLFLSFFHGKNDILLLLFSCAGAGLEAAFTEESLRHFLYLFCGCYRKVGTHTIPNTFAQWRRSSMKCQAISFHLLVNHNQHHWNSLGSCDTCCHNWWLFFTFSLHYWHNVVKFCLRIWTAELQRTSPKSLTYNMCTYFEGVTLTQKGKCQQFLMSPKKHFVVPRAKGPLLKYLSE